MAQTKINKTQAGDGIWTADNLIAGANISIMQVPQPLIDENTLGVWHFENNKDNAVSGSNYTITTGKLTPTNAQYKFDGYSTYNRNNDTDYFLMIDQELPSGDFTVDFWLRTGVSSPSFQVGFNTSSGTSAGPTKLGLYIYQNSTFIGFNTMSSGGTQGSTSYGTTIEVATWHHIAMERASNVANFYLDGVLQTSKVASSTYVLQAALMYQAQGTNYQPNYIDEIRLSNVARYQGQNFTPFTQPYAASAGTAKYQINNTKADPDLSSYLQNTATGTDSLTIKGIATSAPKNTNIGESSIIPGKTGYGVAVGYGATGSTGSVVIGAQAQATDANSVTIGRNAVTNSQSVAIGGTANYSTATTASGAYSIAVGYNAKATASSAIQLGSGTNSTANTFQVFNTTVVDANGKVPLASLPIVQLTQAAYDALATKDANTLYIIIPEESSAE